ncbi:MAG TPA: glycosyltransferase [Archangium sp.]|jgi:UDP:flavonoid glycosyltransferase YjiC (YdhE family)|uniref:glycosyltransferase n=1 Tax=Archangium sp. TaxID=1872627 RepID=UPI002ED91FA4
MRVLFTIAPATGHFHPLVPTARALQQAGHEVAFATAESFHPTVKAGGFLAFPAGIDFEQLGLDIKEVQKRQAAMLKSAPAERIKMMAGMFIDGFARRMAPDLMKVCETWRPDLLLRESTEFASIVVGEMLGIPCASIQVGGVNIARFGKEPFAQHMDLFRADHGLPPDPELTALFRYLNLSFMPASYFGDSLPSTTHYLKLAVFDQSGSEGLPPWTSSLGSRPVVYATLGTVFNKLVHHLGSVAAGLRDEPVDLIITVGRDVDPAQLGPQPPHVHVERYIPQSLLLPRCDLVIMHGGYNSVMSALYAGLPMIIVPLGADQPMNAQACAQLGVARVVEPDALTPEAIRQHVRELLKDGSYRERARRFQAESLALPGIEHGVALLERLAREKQPIPRD